MKKECIECGKAKTFLSLNYAGFDVLKEGKNIYPFVDRIQNIVLPGNRQNDFLCVDCANKRKVKCLKHGEIEGDIFSFGMPPKCKKCDKEKSGMSSIKCIECGNPKKMLAVNYAGFDVKLKGKDIYPFPDRIQNLVLPGNRETDFLCASCANKREIVCSVHGPIKDDHFSLGLPPKCSRCVKDKELMIEEEKKMKEEDERFQREILKEYDLIIEANIKNIFTPTINNLIERNRISFPDVPNTLWDEYLKHFDIDHITHLLKQIVDESGKLTFEEKRDFVQYHRHPIFKKLNSFFMSTEVQEQFKIKVEAYEKKIAQIISARLEGIEVVESEEPKSKLDKRGGNYDLIMTVVELFGLKHQFEIYINAIIDSVKETEGCSDEWLEEYRSQYNIDEVVEFYVPLINDLLGKHELDSLIEHMSSNKSLVQKVGNIFSSDQVQEKMNSTLEQYNQFLIDKIIENFNRAKDLENNRIKFNMAGKQFILQTEGVIDYDRYARMIGGRHFSVKISSFLGMKSTSASYKICDKLKEKGIGGGLPSAVGIIVEKSLLKCNIQFFKKIKVTIGPYRNIRIEGELP